LRALLHPSVGLVGRVLGIVLLTILIEFCASTILYDRASKLRMREDEVHRVAEHLAGASRVMIQRPAAERPAIAGRLSSKNFTVRWLPTLPPTPPMSADLTEMRDQITRWEPVLARHDLRLYLKEPGRGGVVAGSLQLADGSWVTFKAPQLVDEGKFRFTWIVMMVVVALGLSLIAGLMVRQTLRPVRRLAEAAAHIGHGEQQTPIEETGVAEVRGLVRAFNEMQARIHSLITDRVEALAAVGHDLRTPLARLQLRAEGITDETLRREIGGDVTEMSAMVSSLLAYLGGEDDPEKPQTVDLAIMAATLADEVTDRGGYAEYAGIDHWEMSVRPVGFKRAIRNLVENAEKYGKRVYISLVEQEGGALLSIADDGPGIPPDKLEEALRPFIRLDAARGRDTKGLGLGLAIAVRAIEREGGTLRLSNRPEGGLLAQVFLPYTGNQT
jgi:two-component system osmolarity sensor histidine kinase EnvZ